MRQRHDAEASHLELAGERVWRGNHEPARLRFDNDLIVGNEAGRDAAASGKGEKAKGEIRFAAARTSAQQRRVRAEGHASAVNQLLCLLQFRL
jgi:hypothetical protein